MPELSESDIVISGISGRFPESDNIEEFWNNLVSGTELATADDRRWPLGLLGLPPRSGKIKGIQKFDANYFQITDHDSNYMDPQIRLLHEVTYEAIWDSGTVQFRLTPTPTLGGNIRSANSFLLERSKMLNLYLFQSLQGVIPESLRGSRTAVLIGLCYDDTSKGLLEDPIRTPASRPLSSSRISHAFDFHGPCFQIDTACASSFSGLREAMSLIKYGQAEHAVVAGAACHLTPTSPKAFLTIKMIAPDGRSKSLDSKADGYCRSEAVAALFVQKRVHAKRIYASILKCSTNCDGFKSEGITFPGYKMQRKLLRQVTEEARIDVANIRYIEAHVTGTSAGDPVESQAIMDSYRIKSDQPLMFGCLKSNIGHTEGASANCAITKVALIFQKRTIPPNINFDTPNPNIAGLKSGVIVPVLKPTEFHDDIIPVNAFGFGGVNVHALLKANEKTANSDSYNISEGLPRLVNFCNVTSGGLRHTLDWMNSNKSNLTRAFLSLLNDVSKTSVHTGMAHRGYAVLDEATSQTGVFRKTEKKRPLWFVFSALGCQWKAMGCDLMKFEPMLNSIKSSAKTVENLGIDLLHALLSPHSEINRDIKTALISIVAVQIALVDFLKSVGIQPDGILGHSIGEVVAAYADASLTADQALLTAYYLGKCGAEAQAEEGLMAATDLTWEEASARCPPGVYPACHNAKNSVTISGSANGVRAFIEQLKSEDRFVREVDCCGVSYHCPAISCCFEPLRNELEAVIPSPMVRSSSWVSTSLTAEQENRPNKIPCGGFYYANNTVNPVRFREAVGKVPKDACVIEIGPHCSLLGILKMELGSNLITSSLMKRNSENVRCILKALGDIYTSGHNPQIEKLYPEVTYPVERETSSLSPLLTWNHTKSLFVTKFPDYFADFRSSKLHKVDMLDSKMKFLVDHCVDGRNLFPATGYLFLAWQKYCFEYDTSDESTIPIEFTDVNFERATIIPKVGAIMFTVEILHSTGRFVISESDSVCVTGYIRSPPRITRSEFEIVPNGNITTKLQNQDIYKELRIRGYDYGKNFQGLVEATSDGKFGKVEWTGHWISFVDSMLHLSILGENDRQLRVPTHIDYLSCDSINLYKRLEETKAFEIAFDRRLNIGFTTGLYIKGLDASPIPRRNDNQQAMLTKMVFSPYEETLTVPETERKNFENYCRTCGELVENLRQQNYESHLPPNNESGLKAKLIKAVEQKNALEEFLESIVPEDRASFLPTAAVKGLLEDGMSMAIENIVSHEPKVLEINQSSTSLQNDVSEAFLAHLKKYDYTLLKPKSDSREAIELPGHVFDLDLVLFQDSSIELTTSWDTREDSERLFTLLLTSIVKKLRCAGFLLCLFRGSLTNLEMQMMLRCCDYLSNQNRVLAFKSLANQMGLKTVSEKQNDMGVHILLLRKAEQPLPHTLIEVEPGEYTFVNRIKEAVKLEKSKTIWLYSNPLESSGIIGLTKCLRKEPGCERIRCLVSKDMFVPQEVLERDLAFNVYEDDRLGRYTHKLVTENLMKVDADHAHLNVKTRGDLSSFQWFESSHKLFERLPESSKRPGDFMCTTYYSALNFKDVMVATGRIPAKAYPSEANPLSLGLEFSGMDENGNGIFGVCTDSGLSTSIIVNKEAFVFSVPPDWSLAEAATVPVVYLTAYYALFVRAKILPGETVLIHAGSGGVGQAAIRVCLALGCEVFTTVGTEEKRHFLMKMFPQLSERNFANSRTLEFEERVLTLTNGRGVDVVLNSLSDEKMKASINCLAPTGRFVEIGKYDLIKDTFFDVRHFHSGRTFHAACLAHLMHDAFHSGSKSALKMCGRLKDMLGQGIKSGVVVPLPTTVFKAEGVEKAFRYMASGKHIGKVLLKFRSEEGEEREPLRMEAGPCTAFYPTKSYIVVGGLGGMGLELALWLSGKGARNLVLTSRSGVKNNYQTYILNKLKANGVNVKVLVNSGTTEDNVLEIIMEAKSQGKVGGIFNLSLNLKDALLENQTQDTFKETCAGKAETTLYLSELSKVLCPQIDHFVCFSSAASGRGNIGQSNYGFANSVMESICEKRRRDGLPGLAIQWGAIGDVGFVAEHLGGNNLEIGGTVPQRMPSCLHTLDMFMSSPFAVCGSVVLSTARSSTNGDKADLVKTVCHVLGINDMSNITDGTTLSDLGMDSLMAVEIRQTLERDYGAALSPQQVRQLTITKLKELSRQ